jgi:PKD repeat protein
VWDFGDGNTSTLASPQHTYINSGTYSVSLIVTGPGGFDIRNQYDLIVVP